MQSVVRRTRRASAGLVAMATVVLSGALVVPSVAAAPPRPAIPVPTGATSYVALTPSRIADTRPSEGAFGFTQVGGLNPSGGRTIRVQVAGQGGVPPGAKAAVLSVTLVSPASSGFVTVYPAGTSRPTATSLIADSLTIVVNNMVTTQLGTGAFAGAVDIYTHVRMDIVVDVSGAYVPADGESGLGRLVTFDTAQRVYDSRGACQCQAPIGANTTVNVDVAAAGVPVGASAVVVNLTAVNGNPGFWTAYPVGAVLPVASSLNLDFWSRTRGGQAIVQLPGGVRSFNVFSKNGGHLVVDVAGYFTGASAPLSSDGWFIPGSPNRRLDTRNFQTLAPWAASVFEFGIAAPAGPSVGAVAINITGIDPWSPGFLTSYAAGQPRPATANLNLTTFGQRISNHAIVRVTTRGVALYTHRGAHMVADVTGWYLGTPAAAPVPKPTNPVYMPSPALAVFVPNLRCSAGTPPCKSLYVETGSNLDAIADKGRAAGYPSGTNQGVAGNTMLFAHRTSHGGPWRNLDELKYGDTFNITAWDGRVYTYFITRIDTYVQPKHATITGLAAGQGPITAQLVACHPEGSIAYRIVVTGRLIAVT